MIEHQEEEIEAFDIKEVLHQFVSRWYWFVITIPIFLVGASWVNDQAQTIHTIKAKILIEVDNGRVIVNEDATTGLSTLHRSKTVPNEIELLKSRDLISRAVDSLSLHVRCYRPNDIETEIYVESLDYVVEVETLKGHRPSTAAYTLQFKDTSRFEFIVGAELKGTYHLGDTIVHESSMIMVSEREGVLASSWVNDTLLFYVDAKEDILSKYSSMIAVDESGKDADAIEVIIEETIPERGKEFVGMLVDCYFFKLGEDRQEQAEKTYAFIEERLRQNFLHLDSLEYAIDRYKQTKQLTDPDLEAKYILEGIKRFEIELSDARTQKEIVQELVQKSISDPRLQLDLSIPNTMMGVSDPLLNDLILDLNKKQIKLRQLGETVEKDNPLYQEALSEVEELRSSLIVDLLNLEENMFTTVAHIEEQIAKYEKRLSELGFEDKGLTAMERIRNNKEDIYVYLLKKREEAALLLASELKDTWLIEEPYVEGSYRHPQGVIVLVLGVFLGIFIPVTIILIWLLFDDRMRSAKDVKRIVKAPVCGQLSWRNEFSRWLLPELFSTSDLLENFKKIILHLQLNNDPCQVISVTSMGVGEGKTFAATHLAMAQSFLDKSVCLLELNLRKPELECLADLHDASSVIEILDTGELSERELNKRELNGVKVIKAGKCSSDPTATILSQGMKDLLRKLRKEFDTIVIDTSNLNAASDALVVSSYADVNLMVVRQNYTSKGDLKDIRELLTSGKMKNVSVIVNETSRRQSMRYRDYLLESSKTFVSRMTANLKSRVKKKG